LVSAGLTGLLRSLVLELSVVHDLADWRARLRCDLDQVEIRFQGDPERILDSDDPDLLSVRPDESNLRNPDTVVDAQLSGDVASSVR
jgi:hypothetical protein